MMLTKYCYAWERHLDRSLCRLSFEFSAPCVKLVEISRAQASFRMEATQLSIWKMSFSTSTS